MGNAPDTVPCNSFPELSSHCEAVTPEGFRSRTQPILTTVEELVHVVGVVAVATNSVPSTFEPPTFVKSSAVIQLFIRNRSSVDYCFICRVCVVEG